MFNLDSTAICAIIGSTLDQPSICHYVKVTTCSVFSGKLATSSSLGQLGQLLIKTTKGLQDHPEF
jgi:hypothetical protein